MHLNLEALNHILTVITVTAFLYSRKDYIKDIIDTKLLPGNAENNVHNLAKELENKIKNRISRNKKIRLLGIEKNIYDFDDKEINKLSKLLTKIIGIRKEFTNNQYNALKRRQTDAVEKVNRNFASTAFYIALVSFSLLILAAGFQHEDSIKLRIFISVYNLVNISFLVYIYFKKKAIRNTKIISYFFGSLLISIAFAIIPNVSDFFHQFTCNKNVHFCEFLMKISGSDTGYGCSLFITLIFLLTPWIVCFLHFNLIYYTTSKKIIAGEAPIVAELQKYLQYMKTDEEIM